MQSIFLDIPAGAFQKNAVLQSCLEGTVLQAGALRRQGYDRLLLQTETTSELYDLLETVIFQESLHWILREEGDYYRHLLEPEDYRAFQKQAKRRIEKMEPQLRALIRKDLEGLVQERVCLNVRGYLQFSAKRLKRLLQRLMQEEYHRLENELEQEEFIELLRFFISVQPPLLDEAHLTLYGDRFTLTDEWGNDLRQIYLESLLEEELVGISENDLIMSILITLLPRTIFLEVKEPPNAKEFLTLLQRVFGEQMVWKTAEQT